MNRCVICNRDLGDQNPRQLCRKVSCEYQEEYDEQLESAYKKYKEELSRRYIENDWGMFKRKGCVGVDKIIQGAYSFSEAYPKLIELSHKYGYGELLDEIVISNIYTFYSKVEENVFAYMAENPLFEN